MRRPCSSPYIPILPPGPNSFSLHLPRSGLLDLYIHDVACACDIVHQHHQPIRIALELELYAAQLDARYSPGLVLANFQEHVKVLARWGTGAPPTTVPGLGVVWWAEVGGGDGDGAIAAPLLAIVAAELKAGAAGEAIVEEGCAECRGGQTVTLVEEVSIAACTLCQCHFFFVEDSQKLDMLLENNQF